MKPGAQLAEHEQRPHAHQLHDVPPMSCESTKPRGTRARIARSDGRSRSPARSAPRAGVAAEVLAQRRRSATARRLPVGAANEFAAGAVERARRQASRAAASCRWSGAVDGDGRGGRRLPKPRQKIVPFVRRPEEVTPGNPLHFATAYALDGYASGLLVESHEGRPTKIEGNPAHPQTLGATTLVRAEPGAGLYDDDRAKQLRSGSRALAWRTFLAEIGRRAPTRMAEGKGAGLRFLIEPTTSPLLADLRRRILERFPKAKFVSYASLADDGAVEGAKLAFGKPLVPRHKPRRRPT